MILVRSRASLLDDLGDWGNGPLPRGKDRTHRAREAWTLRRVLPSLIEHEFWPPPLEIWPQDAPDFKIVSNERSFFVEITEATDESDQIERARWAKQPKDAAPIAFGALGGRSIANWRLVVEDIARAISSKHDKPFANARLSLIIYANSNPAGFLRPEEAKKILHSSISVKPFREVWVLLNPWLLPLHDVTRGLLNLDPH